MASPVSSTPPKALFGAEQLDSVIALIHAPDADASYDELACSAGDQKNIARLITLLGETPTWYIMRYSLELIQIGREIANVHPMKFLSTILRDPKLAEHLKSIHSSIKWNIVMLGLYKSFQFQHDHGRLLPYLDAFAAEVHASAEALRPMIEAQEWEKMALFLLENA
jgi:hypothetical protein